MSSASGNEYLQQFEDIQQALQQIVMLIESNFQNSSQRFAQFERKITYLSSLYKPSANKEQRQLHAVYDPVTGAINHSAFMTRFKSDMELAVKHHKPLLFALFDIDRMSEINENYGYYLGDEILAAVAERIRAKLIDPDQLGRLGANAFGIVWAEGETADTQQLIESIMITVCSDPFIVSQQKAMELEEYSIPISLRAGVAIYPEDGQTESDLYNAAAQAVARFSSNLRKKNTPSEVLAMPQSSALADIAVQVPAPREQTELINRIGGNRGGIKALTDALENLDPKESKIAQYIAQLAEKTALILGRSKDEARIVGLAALLHNTGNLAIPKAILNKQEALNTEEWDFVRKHPNFGERLLRTIGGPFSAVAPIIAAQREHWNGAGYPLGLKGDAIPLGARITAVCSVFSALISERSYRAAFTIDDAINELKAQSGKQFDPVVVEAFIQAVEDRENG